MFYTVTVSNNICTTSATVKAILLIEPQTVNTFTPNGDGFNDTWKIKNTESYPNLTVEIFNRYGTRVFFSVGYQTAWDGNFRGKPVPAGVYYYLINLRNGKTPLSGYVDVIR